MESLSDQPTPSHRRSKQCDEQQSIGDQSGTGTEEETCDLCGADAWEVRGPQDVPGLLLLCSSCNCQVHVSCAGIERIPDDDWLCKQCSE